MRVLKIAAIEWKNASRDKRELSVYRELGADVLVMAKGSSMDNFKKDSVDGFNVLRFSTRPLGERFPKSINRIISFFSWAYNARKLNADIISGHDLNGLLIGYLSNFGCFKKKRAGLIYDSHEFELGRAVDRSKFQLWLTKQLERFLIKRCEFSIMVNDSVADEVQKIYRLKQRPIVVRNIPNLWELDYGKIAETRSEICNAMGISKDTFLVMYHGYVTPKRNIETLIDAVSRNKHIAGIILGDVSPEGYMEQLKKRARDLGISNRIYFHPVVPIEELYRYVGAADVGTVFLSANYRNEYLALPNKFFENIQSMTPVITFEFPEMKKIIQQYGIGMAVAIDNEEEIDAAIEKMRTDKEFYNQCKKNLEAAKRELCWENEKQILINAFKGVKYEGYSS
jgi:glycosyltransferase involved in cell wall biosynthesis